MKQLNTRMARPEDAPNILEWQKQTSGGKFDQDVLNYPTLQVLCSYNSTPVAYLLTHKALILEATAINPEISELESAQALRDLVKAAQLLASQAGVKEIYFLGTDDRLNAMAEKHNFEKKDLPVFMMKLK